MGGSGGSDLDRVGGLLDKQASSNNTQRPDAIQ